MGRTCTHTMEIRNAHNVLVTEPKGKSPLWRPRHRWEDNIQMNIRETRYGLDPSGSGQGSDTSIVNTVISLLRWSASTTMAYYWCHCKIWDLHGSVSWDVTLESWRGSKFQRNIVKHPQYQNISSHHLSQKLTKWDQWFWCSSLEMWSRWNMYVTVKWTWRALAILTGTYISHNHNVNSLQPIRNAWSYTQVYIYVYMGCSKVEWGGGG
jgi:hypothetical protein